MSEQMILPPFATPKDFTPTIHPAICENSVWFIYRDNQLLVGNDNKTLPTDHAFNLQRSICLGIWKGINLFAGEVEIGSSAPSGWLWSPLRPLHATFEPAEYAIAGYAMQLLHWDRSNKFCGTCGNLTVPHARDRCRVCNSCGYLAYPKLSLAVIALVKRGNQILLARNPQFHEAYYSPLAGFVDPGETLEQCVEREVWEEVKIKVKNVQYFGSQPWPLSYSMMIGFTCDWQEGEIEIDPTEITEAAWFDASNLPRLPPLYSLSRLLVDEYVKTSRNA